MPEPVQIVGHHGQFVLVSTVPAHRSDYLPGQMAKRPRPRLDPNQVGVRLVGTV